MNTTLLRGDRRNAHPERLHAPNRLKAMIHVSLITARRIDSWRSLGAGLEVTVRCYHEAGDLDD